MNYYIKGNAAKAEQIKAAFEKLGYDISWPGGCANPDVINIGVERNGAKYVVAETSEYIKDIIKTHPDYKELKLHVEPKFKVGDWLYHNTYGARPILVKGYSKRKGYKVECIRTTYYLQKDVIENEYHFWSMADAKDGDILHHSCTASNGTFIFKGVNESGKIFCHCDYDSEDHFCLGEYHHIPHSPDSKFVHPATKEQRDLLFAKMKEAGYQWDANKKELRKIQPHYDIKNFHVGMPVLVRADNNCRWDYSVFSRITGNESWQFAVCNGVSFTQCIPFEGNEHLLGTTNMCDERFINW